MSEQIDNGGPAFMIPGGGCLATGMTLRDYFAASVVQGMIAHHGDPMNRGEMAVRAYLSADAMLAARKEEPMSDRPTPRTDTINGEDGLHLEPRYDKMHDLAEELKRELAEARSELVFEAGGIHATAGGWAAKYAEAKEQRDRLEEALDYILNDSISFLRNTAIEKAQAALAAVKGGADE